MLPRPPRCAHCTTASSASPTQPPRAAGASWQISLSSALGSNYFRKYNNLAARWFEAACTRRCLLRVQGAALPRPMRMTPHQAGVVPRVRQSPFFVLTLSHAPITSPIQIDPARARCKQLTPSWLTSCCCGEARLASLSTAYTQPPPATPPLPSRARATKPPADAGPRARDHDHGRRPSERAVLAWLQVASKRPNQAAVPACACMV